MCRLRGTIGVKLESGSITYTLQGATAAMPPALHVMPTVPPCLTAKPYTTAYSSPAKPNKPNKPTHSIHAFASTSDSVATPSVRTDNTRDNSNNGVQALAKQLMATALSDNPALKQAAYDGNLELVNTLLRQGANVSARSKNVSSTVNDQCDLIRQLLLCC